MKTKEDGKKPTENEPETKLAKLLETIEGPKNKAKTNRKTDLAMLLKLTDLEKTDRKRS